MISLVSNINILFLNFYFCLSFKNVTEVLKILSLLIIILWIKKKWNAIESDYINLRSKTNKIRYGNGLKNCKLIIQLKFVLTITRFVISNSKARFAWSKVA